MAYNEFKSIAKKLTNEVEAQYSKELIIDGFADLDGIIEDAILRYEESKQEDLTNREFDELMKLIEDDIDIEELKDLVEEYQDKQKFGTLYTLGMSEKDFY